MLKQSVKNLITNRLTISKDLNTPYSKCGLGYSNDPLEDWNVDGLINSWSNDPLEDWDVDKLVNSWSNDELCFS